MPKRYKLFLGKLVIHTRERHKVIVEFYLDVKWWKQRGCQSDWWCRIEVPVVASDRKVANVILSRKSGNLKKRW